jgi:hypothetical protein
MGMISGWATFILGIFAIVEAERALPVSWMYVGGYAIIIGWGVLYCRPNPLLLC